MHTSPHRAESGLGRLQCAVDADREQSGHQRVALVATLRLGYGVGLAGLVIEEVLKHADERDEGAPKQGNRAGLRHTIAGDVIVGPNPLPR